MAASRDDSPTIVTDQAPTPVSRWTTFWEWCDRHSRWVCLIGALLAALLFMLNLSRSPDFNIDETFYSRAGQNIDNYNAVSFSAVPIRVHPPLFFIAVAAWMRLTGETQSSILAAIHAGRYLNTLFDIGIVVMSAVLCRAWTANRTRAERGRALVGVIALVAFSALLLRFGRLLIIEPMAVFFALVTMWAAWRMRASPAWLYITVVGGCLGLTLLVKETAIFIVVAPMVTAILRWSRRDILRHLGALVVGFALWLAFPVWEIANGDWSQFYFTQTISVRRLIGVLQVSGLNRPSVSPLASLEGTFWQFIGSYLTFAIGAFVLCAAARRIWRYRRHAFDERTAQIVGLGAASYFFLLYGVTVGLSNEQLTVYSVPASALLAMSYAQIRVPHRRRAGASPMLRIVAAATAIAILIGVVNWVRVFALGRDDATERMEAFIRANVPACVPVNSTGDSYHWFATLRTNPITSFSAGPTAVLFGVHLFLLSPKDAEFHYGNSSQLLTTWVEKHGKQIYALASHTSDELSLWQVGTPTVARGATLPGCVAAAPIPDKAHPAPADRFLGYLAAFLGADALAIGSGLLWRRRRRSVVVAAADEG